MLGSGPRGSDPGFCTWGRLKKFPMSKNLFALTVLCLSLSACSTLPSPFASSSAPSSATVAPYRDQVELTGRLNVVYQKDDKPESATVNFNWQQTAQRTDVTLYSPDGSTLATIAVTPQQAVLTQSGKAPDVLSAAFCPTSCHDT